MIDEINRLWRQKNMSFNVENFDEVTMRIIYKDRNIIFDTILFLVLKSLHL